MPLRLIELSLEGPIDGVEDSEFLRSIISSMRGVYSKNGFVPPWTGYFSFAGEQLVGTCAFKSPPREGRVEIAYFTFPEYERRGIGAAQARELCLVARRTQPAIIVTAQTLPELSASTSLLRRLGFERVADVQHPEDGLVWEWELQPDAPLAG